MQSLNYNYYIMPDNQIDDFPDHDIVSYQEGMKLNGEQETNSR